MGCNYLVTSALLLQGAYQHFRGLTLRMWKSYLQGAINFKSPWHHANNASDISEKPGKRKPP